MSGPESMKPDDHLLDEFLAGQGAVRTVYREAASEQAPAHLDAAILLAAQAAARPAPRLRRSGWQMPMAAAAVMVLSFGVFLQVQRDPAVQREVMAVPDQATPAASPAPTQAVQEAAKTEAPAAPSALHEEARADKKPVAAVARKPAPPEKQRRAASKDSPARPPAPPPPVMADTPPLAAAPAPEARAMPLESLATAPAVVAQDSMPSQASTTMAPKAKASRHAGKAAAFAAPAGEAAADAASSDAQPEGDAVRCPPLAVGEAPAISTAAAAIAVARPALIQRFSAETIARHEPLSSALRDGQWRVFGSSVAEAAVGAPEAQVCASTGAVLRLGLGP